MIDLVYASGPLRHCTPVEALGWRKELKRLLGEQHVSDPADRWWIADESLLTPEQDRQVVEGDLDALSKCRGMVCNPWKPSFGTPQEMVYARLWRIPVATVVGPDSSCWVRFHSDYICSSVSEAARWLAIQLNLRGVPCLK